MEEGRKRKRRKRNVKEESVDRLEECVAGRGKGVETRSKVFVGRYVRKEFEGYGVFLGKVVSYTDGLYRVGYEDGDSEDLECNEIPEILVKEGDFDAELSTRKKKLDELISKCKSKTASGVTSSDLDVIEPSSASKSSSDLENGGDKEIDQDQKPILDGDADSSSDSCEFVQAQVSCSDNVVPLIPSPSLPPSSGNIGSPEESVIHLFSVYGFLRSFSIQLFLSPFGLDDFVGSLNCAAPNTLMDGIHLAVMRALRRHLEMLSSDGGLLASKCLGRLDWSLLDTLTWPVYIVEYLLVMGYTKGSDWKGFYTDVLDVEYYSLSVTRKLLILQILCDDVIESAELRAEIDLRESLEERTDSDGTATLPLENGPKRVHPRYSKTSACKDPESMEIITESNGSKPTHCMNLGSKVTELVTDATDVDQDENSDECRLCGMDGTLLCCDGCPSVYHSRCIGLCKMQIPDGQWFCPECTVNKMEPTLRIGTGLRGAETFGIDPYKQVFLGTCDHLLVLKVSISAGPSSRYYNHNDIPKVLQVLTSSGQHTTLYSGICKHILQYWKIPEDSIFSIPERIEAITNPADEKEYPMVTIPVHTLSIKETHKVLDAVREENYATAVSESNLENGVPSCQENDCQEDGLNGNSLDTVNQAILPCLQRDDQQVYPLTNTKSLKQFATESMASTESINLFPNHSDLTHQVLSERPTISEFATCASGNRSGADGMTLPIKDGALSMSCERGEGMLSCGGTSKGDKDDDCLYTGAHFKPQAYTNQYILGDVAASAAANLAVLASEEDRLTETRTSSNPRKVVSANNTFQLEAFKSASIRFSWPISEKKLMEVPRERCGWCLSCKAPSTSRRGCLLNLAASIAIKKSARILGGLRPIKNGEGNLPGIATYILYMEESLHGLVDGPFLLSNYRKQWRKQLENASTCHAIKSLLLELEEHIRVVSFSGDWLKLVDDWSVESSAVQRGASSVGSAPRRPGTRRSRRQSAVSEIATDPCDDDLKKVSWWRGGKLSKLVFQKGILPRAMVKKAARQGGSRKISGINYAEGSEIPKRSRRFAWRAAVEMSMSASNLALQVRYLDLHVRWSDLVRPEQNFHDGKGLENDISAFRNAYICDKKIQDSKITYGLDFGNQKHRPFRILKNIIEVEQNEDGKEKCWFSETHIPLYLIKEYEEKIEKVSLPPSKASHVLSKLQIRQLKASRKDIFSYLMCKEEKVYKCYCASCREDVLLRDAVKCNECEGYCHKECIVPLTVDAKGELDLGVTCNQCYHAKAVSVVKMETHSVMKSPIPGPNLANKGKSGTVASYGLIWKKKNSEETGSDFRLKNILPRGNADLDPSMRPICSLCSMPYNSDLMYICCEHCKCWFHADAVQLKESQIFDVVGFRCCKCRRKASPVCPYTSREYQKPRARASRQSGIEREEWGNTPTLHTEMDEVNLEEDDPLLFSLERVEPITDATSDFGSIWDIPETSFQGPQKLPVRRLVKCETDVDGSFVNPSQVESISLEGNTLLSFENASPPQVEWDFPIDGPKDEVFDYGGVNYEDMEYEPQTYFSFTELLATDDNNNQFDIFDAPVDMSGDWENSQPYNLPEECELGTTRDHQKLTITSNPAINKVPCQMCSNTEPAPDLSCDKCGMSIHSHCSRWVEPSCDRWRCDRCRDWQ